MRTISQFVTDDPKQLGTQLSKFEQNVVTETASIRSSFAPRAVAIDDDAVSPPKTYTAGQAARINTAAGVVRFYLTPPADMLPGEFIVLQSNGASGFTAIAVNCKIDGATSLTPAAGNVLYRFYFDGTDYWL